MSASALELRRRLAEMAKLPRGWDGPHSRPPETDLLASAGHLGQLVLEVTRPTPPRLNLGASADGSVQFNLRGPARRSLELWLHEPGDRFEYLAEEGEDLAEGSASFADYPRLAEWLSGRRASL